MNYPQKEGIVIIGAGLAGSEAALTAARLGVPVTLIEMKPKERTPAHQMPTLAELVCSNSLKSNRPDTAQGLLKTELRSLSSALIEIADQTAVPAGGSLSVNRELFSQAVTKKIDENPLITREILEVKSLKPYLESGHPVIAATGPLTSGDLYQSLEEVTGEGGLHFFDAVAPIADASSIDMDQAFYASRYGKGGADYLNAPMSKEEYQAFQEALVTAQKAPMSDFDDLYFKDCQPIEVLAGKGEDTMRFGPLRPVGLIDPRTGKRPYACLQLRKENEEGSMLSLVGCQTRLTFPEQKRVFGLIPALKEASYFRYGVMHRNSFLNGPLVLEAGLRSRNYRNLYFAGQLSGLEGYVEAIASGLIAGLMAAATVRGLLGEESLALLPKKDTMLGALIDWVTASNPSDFQPMNANFGLLPLDVRMKKTERGAFRAQRSAKSLEKTLDLIESYLGEAEHAHD